MKKDKTALDSLSYFRDIVNSNIEFINRQCIKAVSLKFSNSFDIPVDIVNEGDKLFNRVIEKLTKDDFRLLRKFEGRSKLTTYLTTIISRTAIDPIRERIGRRRSGTERIPEVNGTPVKRGVLSGEKGDYIVPDENSDPEASLIRTDREEKLKGTLAKIISSLSGEERLLLRMKYPADPDTEPLSVREISETLGISQKGVYSRIERILKKCRRFMNGSGVRFDDFL